MFSHLNVHELDATLGDPTMVNIVTILAITLILLVLMIWESLGNERH